MENKDIIEILVGVETAKSILKSKNPDKIKLSDVVSVLSIFGKVSEEELRGDSRSTPLVIWRMGVYYLCRDLTDKTWNQIGSYLGKDHTTVIHGYNKFKSYLEEYQDKVKDFLEDTENS